MTRAITLICGVLLVGLAVVAQLSFNPNGSTGQGNISASLIQVNDDAFRDREDNQRNKEMEITINTVTRIAGGKGGHKADTQAAKIKSKIEIMSFVAEEVNDSVYRTVLELTASQNQIASDKTKMTDTTQVWLEGVGQKHLEQAKRTAISSSHTKTAANFSFLTTIESVPTIPHAIYYHIFVPVTPEGQRNSIRIVKEQIQQIKTSYAHQVDVGRGDSKDLVVYYITLGEDNIITPKFMKDFVCGPFLKCHHVRHFRKGSEMVTLAMLHTFCSLKAQKHSVVTYLHNKGSFHFHKLNENWRPILTDAALSELCLKQGFLRTNCNLCGLQFFAQWTPFIPGNMFSAKCSYVKQLISPLYFATRMEDAISDAMELRLRGQLRTNLLPDRKDFYGLGRYSDEHWVASHPDVVPCDCDISRDHQISVFMRTMRLHELRFGMAPRIDRPPAYKNLGKPDRIKGNDSLRIREYFFLAGNLVKWFSLYGKAPGPESWAWTWFADGEFWKRNVELHGKDAVSLVTRQYSPHLMLLPDPTFDEERLGQETILTTSGSQDNSSVVVFFDFWLAPYHANKTAITRQEAKRRQLTLLKEQIEIVGSSNAISTIYFTVFGRKKIDVDFKAMCDEQQKLNCNSSQHYNGYNRGETPQNIHDFCRHNPSKQVVYLTNSLNTAQSVQYDYKNLFNLMRSVTKAVTSDVCLNEALKENGEKCNVCGLQFYTIPFMHMIGNMWAAPCHYINGLLPPAEFEKRMRVAIRKALIEKIWTRMDFAMRGSLRMEQIGLDGYSMEHWVGSHPTLLPCDISNDKSLASRIEKNLTENDFFLRIGPTAIGASFGISQHEIDRVKSDKAATLREYHFLAGYLLKWLTLYDTIPPRESWVWRLFPMGGKWLHAAHLYGRDVVETLTDPLALSEGQLVNIWFAPPTRQGRLWDPDK